MKYTLIYIFRYALLFSDEINISTDAVNRFFFLQNRPALQLQTHMDKGRTGGENGEGEEELVGSLESKKIA